MDVVLQARAKMSENKVNGPDDVIVSEMIKQLPQEKIYEVTMCFQQRFMGKMEAPNSWKIVKLVFLRKPDAAPKKGIRSYRAIALTSVMSKWYAACLIQLLEKEKKGLMDKSLSCQSALMAARSEAMQHKFEVFSAANIPAQLQCQCGCDRDAIPKVNQCDVEAIEMRYRCELKRQVI